MEGRRRNSLVAALVAVATLALFGGEAAAQADDADDLCAPGQPGVIYGTNGDDSLSGTTGADVICGLGGDDEISGADGDDVIDAGAGDDDVSGGPGADRIFGGPGDDELDGGDGDDSLYGEAGADELSGAAGDDSLSGGEGADELLAAAGDDSLDGGSDADTLDAAAGTDLCVNGESLAGCESDEAPDPLAEPFPLGERPIAAPMTFTIDDTFPGVSVTIETGGGISPWDVEIEPARLHMSGRAAQALAGPAFDISVPASAPPIRGATLTLPYHESRLAGTPEAELRIYGFDEDAQLWVPAPGAQSVDAGTNTVTASVAHFSVYAVLSIRTPEQWEEIFGSTPLRCVGTSADIDVVFLVDRSGSMSTNDPAGLRVDGAKAFADEMRDTDRAAVVAFESFSDRELGLTLLDAAGRAAVDEALDRTRPPGGGTSISAAVQEAIAILSANGGEGRLRVAILLTDGQSSYNSALTTQAANAAIEIHTVGLGAGVNAALLQSIASGTGATYRQLDDPSELPDLYRELAGDIIGDDTDTDGDGLTDCVERNGLFVPLRITLPFIDGSLDFASFVTTDPEDPDTDGDGLVDGAEVEERSLLDDPALAAEYAFLVDAGLETYYKLIANPNDPDSDNDGLNDLLELLNGTNPLSPDDNELGIGGLDLPPFTLFQPDEYEARPAIQRVLTARQEGDTILVESVFYNDTPVRYDDDRNCVEVCAAIEELARERPDDSGFGICVGPISINCADDESQERDIVEEARVAQGIFDGDGTLSENFIREQVAIQCALWFEDAQACIDEAGRADVPDDVSAEDFAAVLGAVTTTLPVPQGINPEIARRIAEALKATAAAVGAAVGTAVIADAVAECLGGPALRVVGELIPFEHPCESLPMYSPGNDTGEAVGHRVAALLGDPTRVLERWASPGERNARPFARNWYIGQPGCTAADRAAAEARWGLAVQCDEFPNWSMERAGPGASLRYMPAADNGREGINLNVFLRACPETTRLDRTQRSFFLVVPVPVLPTIFHCGRR